MTNTHDLLPAAARQTLQLAERIAEVLAGSGLSEDQQCAALSIVRELTHLDPPVTTGAELSV